MQVILDHKSLCFTNTQAKNYKKYFTSVQPTETPTPPPKKREREEKKELEMSILSDYDCFFHNVDKARDLGGGGGGGVPRLFVLSGGGGEADFLS